jgi:SAM-dependent methyltransferase
MDERYKSGACLYGDDLRGEALDRWYAEEELGYFQLTNGLGAPDPSGDSNFWKHLNQRTVKGFLGNRTFATAVAFGTANGDDVAPFAERVERFIGVEPQESWWANTIAGKPAKFVRPGTDSSLPLPDAIADVIFCFGVLHHVARVSTSLSEFSRILTPGGVAVVREPISSMGEWTMPRPGATRNERGIDPGWMRRAAEAAGLEVVAVRPVAFAPLIRVLNRGNWAGPGRFAAGLDALLSNLFFWNHRYHRETWPYKIAPGAAYYLLRKPVSTSSR